MSPPQRMGDSPVDGGASPHGRGPVGVGSGGEPSAGVPPFVLPGAAPPGVLPGLVLDVHLGSGAPLRLRVLDVGLACCAVEAVIGAVRDDAPEQRLPVAGPGAVEVLIVSGTVTDKMAPLVRRLHASLPSPVKVVSFGACANSGGPYWDSYCVTPGVAEVVPVDVWVPGCPPRPELLLAALRSLSGAAA